MNERTGSCVIFQSGGPTSVINASLLGVIKAALKSPYITNVYGAANGIKGVLEEKFYDISQEDEKELELLRYTPSAALGSCRYKMADADVDDTDYRRILEVFKKHNIRYLFGNGGNDSMDTCNKISKYLQKEKYACKVIGIPKTIDNDLAETDHCPGYGCAAKYIATTCMEVYLDARVYDTGMITVIEVMGRNAGWLTAASALAVYKGAGPDLIYLPEVPFNLEVFLKDTQELYKKNGKVIIAVSEGIRDKDGVYISDYGNRSACDTDAFGHQQLGGLAPVLTSILKQKTGAKVRGIELSLLQRCAAHIGSATDIEESYIAGQYAVECAEQGITDVMVAFKRANSGPYAICPTTVNLGSVANFEKKVPLEWINDAGNGMTQEFIDYALPLIQGETGMIKEDSLPRFALLKKTVKPC
jgi:6-phosphofructokinase